MKSTPSTHSRHKTYTQRIATLRARMGYFWPILWSQMTMLVVFMAGTWAYMELEGWSLLDSVYMVMITLATVGFQEVHPLSELGRVITIALIAMGVGNFAFLLGAISQMVADGHLSDYLGRKRIIRSISKLKNHCIVCGYGRVGAVVTRELQAEGVTVVVVDRRQEVALELEAAGVHYLIGDATSDEMLNQLNLPEARALVAAMSEDASNVYLVLSARQLNPDMTIVARANEQTHIKKMRIAGADTVLLPSVLGGVRIAQSILRPDVLAFMEQANERSSEDVQIEIMPVLDKCPLVGKTVRDCHIREEYNLIIIGIKNSQGDMLFNPGPEAVIKSCDMLLLVGRMDDFKRCQKDLT